MLEYDLSPCPLFANMHTSEIEDLVHRCVSDVKEFAKGEYIVRQGTPIQFLYLLVAGSVRTAMLTQDDNVLEIDTLTPITPLAPAFIFANQNIFPVDVVALEPTVLFLIPKSTLQQEMMQNAKLFQNFLRINSNMIVFLSRKVQMLSIRSLRMKLAIYFLENTSEEQTSFHLHRTQSQLAEYFGVQRPSLSRTLGAMITDGAISLDRQQITIRSRQKLRSYL